MKEYKKCWEYKCRTFISKETNVYEFSIDNKTYGYVYGEAHARN